MGGTRLNVEIANFEFPLSPKSPQFAAPLDNTDIARYLGRVIDQGLHSRLPSYIPPGTDVLGLNRELTLRPGVRLAVSSVIASRDDEDLSGLARKKRKKLLERRLQSERLYSFPAERTNTRNPALQMHEAAAPWSVIRSLSQTTMILGDPGIGKSWLLRIEQIRLSREAQSALAATDEYALPVPITAHALAAAKSLSLEAKIARHLRENGLFDPVDEERWIHWLTENPLAILMDGFDEVSAADREEIRELLRRRLSRPPRDRLVATSRLAGYSGPILHGQLEVEVLPLSPSDAVSLIDVWPMDSGSRSALISRLTDPDFAAMSRIPVLLAFMCDLATVSLDLPTNRRGLYLRMVRRFLGQEHRRAGSRRANRVDVDGLLAILPQFAFAVASDPSGWRDLLSVGDVRMFLEQILPPGSKRPRILQRALTRDTAILIAEGPAVRGRDPRYMFLHRTVMEHLIAEHLAQVSPKDLLDVLRLHGNYDVEWVEVISMLGAALSDEALSSAIDDVLKWENDALESGLQLSLRLVGGHERAEGRLKLVTAKALSGRLHTALQSEARKLVLEAALEMRHAGSIVRNAVYDVIREDLATIGTEGAPAPGWTDREYLDFVQSLLSTTNAASESWARKSLLRAWDSSCVDELTRLFEGSQEADVKLGAAVAILWDSRELAGTMQQYLRGLSSREIRFVLNVRGFPQARLLAPFLEGWIHTADPAVARQLVQLALTIGSAAHGLSVSSWAWIAETFGGSASDQALRVLDALSPTHANQARAVLSTRRTAAWLGDARSSAGAARPSADRRFQLAPENYMSLDDLPPTRSNIVDARVNAALADETSLGRRAGLRFMLRCEALFLDEEWLALLQSPDWEKRSTALHILARRAAPAGWQYLIALTGSAVATERSFAAYALGKWDAAVPAEVLERLAQDPSPAVLRWLPQLIKTPGAEGDVRLFALLRDGPDEVRRGAFMQLQVRGVPVSEDVYSRLVTTSGSGGERQLAGDHLSPIGTDLDADLGELLSSHAPGLRRRGRILLATEHTPDRIPELLPVVDRLRGEEMQAVSRYLARLEDPAVLHALVDPRLTPLLDDVWRAEIPRLMWKYYHLVAADERQQIWASMVRLRARDSQG